MDFGFNSNREILAEMGRRFKEARINSSFTQQELAKHTGVSRTTITRLEGGAGISMLHFIALLRAVDHVNDLSRIIDVSQFIDPEKEFKHQQAQSKRVRH
ncbi:helix-turn-helix domain-containing protein [Fulvivirga ligni]|uniref:helix-turn-helix domain-containing protein n=1 Tax=Fulvivirga ligni TaxID=2904246 RepID=UPI001F2E4607|nr:helix-turn-helix transcriptional regulator [Fulvivirga ligni]UII21574.1 helix-turn-helix domain-containing protein [Fulvivirga ligni]UII21628.1 helix-turn-helix domain-containing protein [Fulvivirga ligni]